MRATQRHLLRRAVPILLVGAGASAAFTSEQPADAGQVSKRLSDAILAEFRSAEIGPPAPRDASPDPGVFMLPPMEVQASRHYGTIDSAAVNAPTMAIPVKFGTGITEYRGKKVTALTQRVLERLEPTSSDDRTDYAAIRRGLVEAQRAWLAFRDADCQARLKLYEAGSIRGAVYLGCLTERTDQRTKELRRWTQP